MANDLSSRFSAQIAFALSSCCLAVSVPEKAAVLQTKSIPAYLKNAEILIGWKVAVSSKSVLKSDTPRRGKAFEANKEKSRENAFSYTPKLTRFDGRHQLCTKPLAQEVKIRYSRVQW